ncbi:hypothetical protein [Gulbenkiania mobilis]|uniref:hypothetical protein n=1 Tax=Gulbenkiania mobilis TaxID=397457 RepID=UPI001910C9D2|nr:hypothetical protein [Gulbenkiania mobilis]
MIDPKWLDVFKLPLKVTVSIALASLMLLIIEMRAIVEVGEPLRTWARPVLLIILVVFGTVSIVGGIAELLAPLRERQRRSALSARREVRRQEEQQRRLEAQGVVIARLDTLSKQEVYRVAECLRSGSPSFYTYVYSPPVGMLQAKGLVWSTGGTHHQDHYPFSFHDFAWEAILARKEEFLAKEAELKRADEEEERRRRNRALRGL